MAGLAVAACLTGAVGATPARGIVAGGSPAKTITISAAASPTRTVVGSTVTITGKASFHLPNPTVDIERKVNGVWQFRTHAKVDSNNAFRTTIKPSQRGSYALRVRYPFANLVSKTFYIEVFAGMGGASGHGGGNTRPIYFSGGTYFVIGSYYDTGDCYWWPTLQGITDEFASYDMPDSTGSSTKTYLYRVEPGSYYIDMLGSGDGACNWAITFYRE